MGIFERFDGPKGELTQGGERPVFERSAGTRIRRGIARLGCASLSRAQTLWLGNADDLTVDLVSTKVSEKFATWLFSAGKWFWSDGYDHVISDGACSSLVSRLGVPPFPEAARGFEKSF